MALVINDRVKVTSTTTGTGAFALGSAVTGFETFAQGIGNSNETYYCIFNQGTSEFEVGRGTLDGTSDTTLLAAGNYDAVIGIRCCNILTSTIAVDVKIAKGGADYFIAKGVSIPPNSAIELIQGGAKIVLQSGDTLEAVSDTASSLDVTLSYIDTISS